MIKVNLKEEVDYSVKFTDLTIGQFFILYGEIDSKLRQRISDTEYLCYEYDDVRKLNRVTNHYTFDKHNIVPVDVEINQL